MNSRFRAAAGVFAPLIAGLVLAGCASSHPAKSFDSAEDGTDSYRVSCEASLIELERLIALRVSQEDFPRDALLEAQELHRLGRELYLERDYILALELIEEGIQLVEEQHH